MDHNQPNDSQNAAESGDVQNGSESFRTLPKASESFGTIRNDSARFGNVPHLSERKQNHTLTVREAARMFEMAGVARTERSIVNWCQPNRQGIPRLDSYFDPNERRYYITPDSIEMAISEEKARAAKTNEPSEPFGTFPTGSERAQQTPAASSEAGTGRIRELEMELMDLKITNRGKDFFIEQLQKERNGVLDQLLTANRKVGELESRLLQLEGPKN
ncbi:MAG TPA: hypothetical protein VGY56_10900 [Verrucomicrobiae bacterium]|nr:hypothetical protein [Verrucomicrobiae bacterium]